MNYISIYLYYTLEDELKTYQFMVYIMRNYLRLHFSDDLKGVMRFSFITDKLLEISQGSIWLKLCEEGVISIHFSVSIFMTVFSTYIPDNALYPAVDCFWDYFLAGGFDQCIKILLYLISCSSKSILKANDDLLMMAIK